MIQDIKDYTFHNEYTPQSPQNGDYIMFVDKRTVLIRNTDNQAELDFPKYDDVISENTMDTTDFRYLFSMEKTGEIKRFFLGNSKLLNEDILKKYHFENQNCFRVMSPDYMAFAGVTACQLANWYHSCRFCGTCGTELKHDEKERMMRCPKCNAMHYPKISPAVIVAVTDQDRIVMTKYADRDYKKYALIAGFAEIGESIEDTVRREVMEEVGLKVKNITYYKSQPWSFSDTLLFGFYCELDGDDTIVRDEEELSVAEWLTRDEIPTKYDGISLTNEMIMRFKEGN